MNLKKFVILSVSLFFTIAFIQGYYFTYREFGLGYLSEFNRALKVSFFISIGISSYQYYLMKKEGKI